MSTSNTEGATSNKRTRDQAASDKANAGSAGAAAAAATTDAKLGARLAPIKLPLESQPEELQGTIISLIKEMLVVRDALTQRNTSYARFDQPSKDSTTGEVVKDKEGNPLPFIPGSLREKCPLKASSAANNDNAMAKLLEEAKQEHADYLLKMTATAKKIAAREISIREEVLRSNVYKLLDKMALAHTIRAELSTGRPEGCNLERKSHSHLITSSVLRLSTDSFAKKLGMDAGANLADEYQQKHNCPPSALANEADDSFMTPIITKLAVDLPAFTTTLWDLDDKKDIDRKINAEIKKELQKAATLEATEDVEMEMDAIDLSNAPAEKLISFIDKQVQKGLDKKTVQFKRALRKNSSGEAENQTSKPTANGTKSNKNSAAQKKKKQKQGTSNQKDQSNAASSKKRKDKADTSNRNQKKKSAQQSAKAGKADGSKGGGKKRGAARR